MSDSRDVIQARLLSNVDDTYNKSEGEFIYDALKPVAIELESSYVIIDGLLDKAFADTATGKNLERIVKSVGLTRKTTIQSSGIVKITGVVGSAIIEGDLVASDSVNFIFTETTIIPESGYIDVEVQCSSYGTVGNVPIGAIKYFPKTLAGLQTVTNLSAFTNGYDEETNEELRARYYTKVQTPATSGNKYHYLNWALEVTGVGNAKVLPLWNGNGTVKVIIINSNMLVADSTLVSNVANYIEAERPIGANVTVVSATGLSIKVNVIITIDSSATTKSEALDNIKSAITKYLANIAFKQDYVSYAKIGSIILDVTGVEDYSNLLINSGTSNISIADTQVAILGGVTLG